MATTVILNLIEGARLPVRRASGRVDSINPSDLTSLIDSDPVVAIASPRADFDRALLEFLVGLLATACPPIDTADWLERYRRPPTPRGLAAAFAPFAEAFDLDGDGPRFMQDFEDFEGDEIPIAQLLIEMPGANTLRNNADHFVKRGQIEVLSRWVAAMGLFTLQTYAPKGGRGHRTSLRGGGPLTTLVAPEISGDRAATLWSMLWANVPDRPGPGGASADIFPWLGPMRVSDGRGAATTPPDVNPLQAFWGMPRRIRLIFVPNPDRRPCDLTGEIDDVVVTGFRQRPWGTNCEGWVHPLTPYYRQKSTDPGLLPVHGRPGGIGWRDYLGIVASNEPENATRLPAACVTLFRQNRGRRVSDDEWGLPRFRLLAFGYDMDNNMKARGWAEGVMPLWVPPEAALLGPLDDFARALVNGADIVRRVVTRAVKSALLGESSDEGDWSWIDERFWAESEADFHQALADIDVIIRVPEVERAGRATGPFKTFFERLKRLAFRIFDDEVSIDALADADLKTVRNRKTGLTRIVNPVIEARKALAFVLAGYSKQGVALYGTFGLPSPEQGKAKSKAKGRKS
jgi:CRISPR system Cascade subunit CasA